MHKKSSLENKNLTLREKAEHLFLEKTKSHKKENSLQMIQEALQELCIHQIELEMQNEELQEKKEELHIVKERYFDLYELAPVGYCTLNEEGKILQANLTMATLFALPKSKLLGQSIKTFIFHEDQDVWYLHCQKILEIHKTRPCELRMSRGNGTLFWAHFEVSKEHDANGVVTLHLTLSDISSHKQAQIELGIAAIAFESQNGIIITDDNGDIIKTNKAFTRITGYEEAEMIGKNPALLHSGKQNSAFYQDMWIVLNEQGHWQGEIWDKRKNGEIYPVLLSITAVNLDGLGITHYIGTFVDITVRKELEATIHALAYYDALTKLPNRRLVQDRLVQAIGAVDRSGMYGALLFIDVDYFKLLNDTRGHDVGDLLLIEIAKRLRSNIRFGDTVGRQGGDEFIILLSSLSTVSTEAAAMALQFGRKIYETFEKPFDLNGFEYPCKISTGICLFQKDSSVEELFKHADIALYQAKDAGRNTLQFFDPKMQEAINLRTTLESELHAAIALQEFCLYYQPQVDKMGNCIGVEALIRWKHPKRGLVSPLSFIPLAEDTGLILSIGRWVLESACAKLKEWEKTPLRQAFKMAINVSPRQFRQPNYVFEVAKVLKKSGINPALLKIELTEGLVLEDIVGSIEKMHELKKLGINFSMDDFGTGYSSLSYLTQLPLSQLKIDKSFIDNVPGEKNNEMITRTIIAMGEGMEINVIAEGVETEAQKDFLLANGCDFFQGYLFSHPLPSDELEVFLDKNARK